VFVRSSKSPVPETETDGPLDGFAALARSVIVVGPLKKVGQ